MPNSFEDLFRKLMLFSRPEQAPMAGLSAEVGSPVTAIGAAAQEINGLIPPVPPKGDGVGNFLARRLNPRTAWREISTAPEIGPMALDFSAVEPMAKKIAADFMRRFGRAGIEKDDVIQEMATEMLLKADKIKAADDPIKMARRIATDRGINWLKEENKWSDQFAEAAASLGDEGDELTDILDNMLPGGGPKGKASEPAFETLVMKEAPPPTATEQILNAPTQAPEAVAEELSVPATLAKYIAKISDPTQRLAAKTLTEGKGKFKETFSHLNAGERASLATQTRETLKQIAKIGIDLKTLQAQKIRDLEKNFPAEHAIAKMRLIEGRSVEEIAAALKTTPKTIKDHLSVAQAKIKTWMDADIAKRTKAIQYGMDPKAPTAEGIAKIAARVKELHPEGFAKIQAEVRAKRLDEKAIFYRLQKLLP